MRRLWYVYLGALTVTLKCLYKRAIRHFGELFKRLGRRLVLAGEDNVPRWNLELLRRCYIEQADAEFHIGMDVFRGPMCAAFLDGNKIIFKMNWLASRSAIRKEWEEHKGTGNLVLKNPGSPVKLPTGDVWFTFSGGYAILFLGIPKAHLAFDGPKYTIRAYTYF